MCVEIDSQSTMPCPVRRGGGGAVAQRHDGKGNLLAYLLSKVCKNIEVFDLRSTVTSSEARFNIKDGSVSGHAKLQHFLIGVLRMRTPERVTKTNLHNRSSRSMRKRIGSTNKGLLT